MTIEYRQATNTSEAQMADSEHTGPTTVVLRTGGLRKEPRGKISAKKGVAWLDSTDCTPVLKRLVWILYSPMSLAARIVELQRSGKRVAMGRRNQRRSRSGAG